MFSKSIGQVMDDAKTHTSGFDYLRLLLSLAIIAWHTLVVCYGVKAEVGWWISDWRPLLYFLVPGFFALSGFLVASSLYRVNRLLPFLTLRSLRIFPALCCEVLISALLLGPILTKGSVGSYFSDPLLHEYFLNIFGDIHYLLPGVFEGNPFPKIVNIQLWTVPYELECYVILAFIAFVRLVRHPVLTGLFALVFTAGAHYYDYEMGRLVLLERPPELTSIACCLWGTYMYIHRYKIPYHFGLFALSIGITWWAFNDEQTTYIATLPVTYITVYLGLMNPKKIFLVSSGDYSYGLYLYGFPIQQAIAYTFPQLRVWYYHLPVSLALTAICAFLSWRFLESKILGKKKQAIAHVNRFTDWVDRKFTSLVAPAQASLP